MTIGFHCSHEQHSPSALLRHAKRAAEAGFSAAMCSDHLQPWSERQGHSGFTWSWLGAAMEATPMSFGTVCAPGQRYHPVIIAQAVATLVEMYPGRFWLSVGSGEALNESVTGEPWPAKQVRNARLEAAVDMMRALWAGDTVSSTGLIHAHDAKVHVPVEQPPLIVGAALSEQTAHWLANWADALVTIAGDADTTRRIVEAFREGGGAGKPVFLQVALSYAPTEEEAERAAHDQWRHAALPAEQLADLRTPEEFDRAAAHISRDTIARKLRVSSDIHQHVAWLENDIAMGFERIYLHNVAREHQERFIDACAKHVLPAFSGSRI
jgi:probable non-F420 flavinoid oxidoreductase